MVCVPGHQATMDHNTYKIIHLVGISILGLGVGGMMAGGANRKPFAICQGIGLLVMLVSGVGMLHKLNLGYPPFAIVKIVLWLVIGMLPLIFRKLKLPVGIAIVISLAMVSIMAWLGVMKPVFW